jgi:uncharacterized membrane protein YdcZ (DUF606 family)
MLTGYFSCQFENTQFTKESYWAWFGGILGASILSLMVVGLMSGGLERRLIHKSFSRSVLDFFSPGDGN